MKIELGMTNHIIRKGKTVIKKYKQETVIKGLGKTALQRMIMEFYFSKLFSNSLSTKPLKMDLNKGETTFTFFDGVPLTSLLSNSSVIPEEILKDISKILLNVSKNKLKTDKQSLQSYSNTFNDFVDKSSTILDEYTISKKLLTKYNLDIYNVFSESFDKQPEVVTHGDFWLGNLLYNKNKKILKLIDWEFADAGSIYLDLGTYYCYSLGFANGADLFLKNAKLQNYSIQLIRYFAIYRILRILSFVTLEDVKKTNISNEYGLAYLINVLKIFLEDISSFQLDTGKEIMESIDSRTKVSILVMNQDERVLLLKRKLDDKFPNMWEPPGGRKEKKEMILDAVKRELLEETGVSVDVGLKYIGETNFSIKDSNKKVNAVFFSLKTNNQAIKISEHGEFGWFTIEEAIKLVDFEFIKQLLKKI